MSVASKSWDNAVAAAKAAATSSTPTTLVDTLKIGGRLWRHADKETRSNAMPVLIFIYAWIAALILFAFFQINSMLLLMAVLPILGFLYVITVEPFKAFSAGIADEILLEGFLRKTVFTILVSQLIVAALLRLIPLHANPELGMWMIVLAIGAFMSNWALSGTRSIGAWLVVGVIVLAIILIFSDINSRKNNAPEPSNQGQPAPSNTFTNNQPTTNSQRRNVPTNEHSSTIPEPEQMSPHNEPVVAVPPPPEPVQEDPFYDVKVCEGEPSSYELTEEVTTITIQPGCWTAQIEAPPGSIINLGTIRNAEIMYWNGEVAEFPSVSGPGTISGEGFRVFRVISRSPQSFNLTLSLAP